ncbi:hypothetical protein [Nocardioides yefusunii]|uniref:DUF2567 domain-containing protein n=1 Tax=Nocardioides yefusunii TaxID=2500546 RepID=A0ABW1QXE1_9ACTN|nr:hypothetical protein [Nocardioides yefusunii]
MTSDAATSSAVKPTLVRAAWVVGLGLLLGAVAGVVWEAWWTPPTGAALGGRWLPDTAGSTEVVDAFGTFAVVGGVLGVVYGLAVVLVARGRDVVTALSLFVGALLSARVAEAVGGWLGPEDADAVAAQAEDLTPIVRDLVLPPSTASWWPDWLGSTVLLVPAFAALSIVVVVNLAGWGPKQKAEPVVRVDPADSVG